MTNELKATKSVASKIENGTLTLTFSNGETLSISPEQLSAENAAYAALHGLKQKLCDAAAMLRNPDTGASATIQDKYEAVREIYDRLIDPAGTWNKIRGDGTGAGTGGLLIRALMAMFGKSEEDTRALLDACSDDEVKALRANSKVVAKMAEFRKVNTKIDTEALLSKFGA